MTALRQETVTCRGELVEWRTVREGWGFGSVRTGVETIRVVGTLVGVRQGCAVECSGIWETHARYGRQLKVRSCAVVTPESTDGIVAWLSSTLPDVGGARARKLVERFGPKLWDVIESDPAALTVVDGITLRRAEAIAAAYQKHRADRDAMVTLRGWGLTENQVGHCVERYGELRAVVDAVRSNPYQLSTHVHGFGFKRADLVATKVGVALDAPERIEAGVCHVLAEACDDGHCYVTRGLIAALATELLAVPDKLIYRAIDALVRRDDLAERLGPERSDGKPRAVRVFLPHLDRAEATCAQRLAAMRAHNAA